MPKLEFLYKGSITYWLKTQTLESKRQVQILFLTLTNYKKPVQVT